MLDDDGRLQVSAAASMPDTTSAAHVAKAASQGAAGLVAFALLSNVLQLISSLILARAVAPEQYGAFAVGATVVGFARFLGDCGAGSVVIQQRGPSAGSARQLGQALTIQILIAVTAASLLVLSAPALQALLNAAPEATWIVSFLALSLVLEAPGVVPKVRLRRQQRFRRLQAIDTIPLLVLYSTQIVLLLSGFGIAALVAGQVVASAASTIALVVFGGGLVRPVVKGALALARRGAAYQGTLVVQALFSVTSLGVVGTQLDAEELGLWTWSTVLATPLITLALQFHHVVFPSLARIHEHHPGHHGGAVETVARLQLSFVAVAVGLLSGLTVPIVRLVFDPRWLDGTGAARAALLGVIPLVLATLLAASLESQGRPDLRLRSMVVSVVTGLGAMAALAGPYGAAGAGIASYLVVHVVDTALLLWWSRQDVRRALLDAVLVGGGTFAVAHSLAARVEDLQGLLLAAMISGVVGLVLLPVVDRPAMARAWLVVRSR